MALILREKSRIISSSYTALKYNTEDQPIEENGTKRIFRTSKMKKLYSPLLAILIAAPFGANATVWDFTTSSVNYSGISSVQAFSTEQVTNATGGAKFGTTGVTYTNYSSGNNGYYGMGINSPGDNNTQPDHAFDNDGASTTGTDNPIDGAVDAALFQFNENTALTGLSIGYWRSDADISILAFTGTLNGTALPDAAKIAGKSFAQLIAAGWQLVSNLQMVGEGTTAIPEGQFNDNQRQSKTFNPTGSSQISSSYWLISAYTDCANAAKVNNVWTCQNAGSGFDFGDDYFKLAKLTGNTVSPPPGNSNSVPEPASLFLMIAGLWGWRINSSRNKLLVA